jgi:voltage-gated potassium channel
MMEFTLYFLRVFALDLLYAGPFLLFLVAMIGLIGYLIGRIEGWSSSDALYHAFINATTVGYGDFRPTKRRSKLLAVILALVGLVFTGVVVAIALHAADYAYGEVYQATGFRDRFGE